MQNAWKKKKCFYIWGWEGSKYSVRCAEPRLHLPQITNLIPGALVVRKYCSLFQFPGASSFFSYRLFSSSFPSSSRLLLPSHHSLYLFLNTLNEEEIQLVFLSAVCFEDSFFHDIDAFLSQDTFFNRWEKNALSLRCFSAFSFSALFAWVPNPPLLPAAQSRCKKRNKRPLRVIMKEVLPIVLLTINPRRYLEKLER